MHKTLRSFFNPAITEVPRQNRDHSKAQYIYTSECTHTHYTNEL